MDDQTVHVFDDEHQLFAEVRQQQYPEHADHSKPRYDWARGVVCGCGVVLGAGATREISVYKHPEPPPITPTVRIWAKDRKLRRAMTREQRLDWDTSPVAKFNHVNGTNVQSWADFEALMAGRSGASALIGAAYITPSAFENFGRRMEQAYLDPNIQPSGVVAFDRGTYPVVPKWQHTGESDHDLDAAGNCRDERCHYNSDVEHERMRDYADSIGEAERFEQGILMIAEEQAKAEAPTRLFFSTDLGPASTGSGSFDGFPTETSRRIFSNATNDLGLVQEWAKMFMGKQQDYGDRANDLGVPGQYAEMSRKFIKLRKAMWEGKPLVGEPAREVVMDLIGHCFLTLKLMEDQNWGGKADV